MNGLKIIIALFIHFINSLKIILQSTKYKKWDEIAQLRPNISGSQ
jgi:hypothetical protein